MSLNQALLAIAIRTAIPIFVSIIEPQGSNTWGRWALLPAPRVEPD